MKMLKRNTRNNAKLYKKVGNSKEDVPKPKTEKSKRNSSKNCRWHITKEKYINFISKLNRWKQSTNQEYYFATIRGATCYRVKKKFYNDG